MEVIDQPFMEMMELVKGITTYYGLWKEFDRDIVVSNELRIGHVKSLQMSPRVFPYGATKVR